MADTPVMTPVVCQKEPFGVSVEVGKKYFWCTCGLSATQPFCDGSHKGTSFKSVKFTADETKTIGLCGCKHTKNQPKCDGSHKNLVN